MAKESFIYSIVYLKYFSVCQTVSLLLTLIYVFRMKTSGKIVMALHCPPGIPDSILPDFFRKEYKCYKRYSYWTAILLDFA